MIDIISENGVIVPKHVVRVSKRLYFAIIIVCDQNIQLQALHHKTGCVLTLIKTGLDRTNTARAEKRRQN
jgi:hypothetical protein